MRKLSKKLLLSILSVALVFIALGTTTFAWFSMNAKVTVTGMQVRTNVANNLLIAPCETETTAKVNENLFKTNYTTSIYGLLEPVSTVDGVNFFYTSSTNVDAAGDAAADAYIAYASGDTFDANYGLNSSNTTADGLGYVDYAFQLKAVNSQDAVYYVNITNIDLLYNGATTEEKAFRVAIFVDDMGATGATAATAPSTTNLKTILRHTGAQYFGAAGDNADEAVKTVSTLAAVDAKIDDAALIGSIDAKATKYFKVVVRLWLEGEDTTCNNEKFASLTSSWALNMSIEFQNATGGVTALGKTNDAATVNLSAATVSFADNDKKVIDGVVYGKLSVQLNSKDIYTTDSSLYSDSRIFTITDNKYLTDVTNQCTLPNTPRS